jgi:hypothetical protein
MVTECVIKPDLESSEQTYEHSNETEHGSESSSAHQRTTHTVQEVFQRFRGAFLKAHKVTAHILAVIYAICKCLTRAMGGHLYKCPDCGHKQPHYNPCRNRNCPNCKHIAREKWIQQRTAVMLPVGHFHLVFTLPEQLRSLFLNNFSLMGNIMFACSSEILQELARETLGAQLGFSIMLHTWTRSMHFHPHLHCIVSAGGLAFDETRWVSPRRPDFLFSISQMRARFKAKYLAAIRKAHKNGQLKFNGTCKTLSDPMEFKYLTKKLWDLTWCVYAKEPFKTYDHLIEYIGRYTHHVAISNSRILWIKEDQVCIRTRDDQQEIMTGVEFIRRFCLHILPRNFTKMRHYGLYSPHGVHTSLETARQLLSPRAEDAGDDNTTSDSSENNTCPSVLSENDPFLCPACKKVRLVFVGKIPRLSLIGPLNTTCDLGDSS